MHSIDLPLLKDFNLSGKRILIRADFNVPIENQIISDDSRIKASLATINYCLEKSAKVLLISHLGRISAQASETEKQKYSLKIVANHLAQLMNKKVQFVTDWQNYDFDQATDQLFLLENIRYYAGESSCDPVLSKKIAQLADLLVIDCFGTAHRKHASTYGAIEYANQAASGLLFEKEIDYLNKILYKPQKPIMAIVGGSKISTKLAVLNHLLNKVNHIILGGGIINTFLLAQGYDVGNSLVEKDLLNQSLEILKNAKNKGVHIHLPIDVAVAKEFKNNAQAKIVDLNKIESDDIILDIGPKSSANFVKIIKQVKTILWNGPIGVFEFSAFSQGTAKIAKAIAKQTDLGAISVAGGGDTVAAINQFGISQNISYISTGGGAFLEFIEGKKLPVIAALSNKKSSNN